MGSVFKKSKLCIVIQPTIISLQQNFECKEEAQHPKNQKHTIISVLKPSFLMLSALSISAKVIDQGPLKQL
jgi:hypothetical protein